MKSSMILLMGVLITSIFGIFGFDNVFAQSLEDFIESSEFTQFTTQKTSCTYAETIVISGNIEMSRLGEPARIHIDLPTGDTFLEFDTSVDDNGDFTFEITAGGEGWTEEGTYTLGVTHDVYFLIESNTSFEYANFIHNENKIEPIFKQLDEQTQINIQSLDSKILREQSQYDEYYKQYVYYEEMLSQIEDPKFSQILNKLNLFNVKINSLIDERNMLLFLYDDVFEPVEDKVEPEPEKQLFCFLWWCW